MSSRRRTTTAEEHENEKSEQLHNGEHHGLPLLDLQSDSSGHRQLQPLVVGPPKLLRLDVFHGV